MYQRKERIILLSMYYSYTLILASFQAFINPIDFMANTWAFASCDLHTFSPKSEHKNSWNSPTHWVTIYRLTKSHICLDKVSESAGCWSCFGRCTLRKFPKEVIIRLKILKQFTTPIFNNTYIFQIGEQVTVFFCNYEPWTQ